MKNLLEERDLEEKFIKNLITERKKKGLSQRDLAYKTGLTQQVISSFESGSRRPTLLNLIKYLMGLGIDINKIFD